VLALPHVWSSGALAKSGLDRAEARVVGCGIGRMAVAEEVEHHGARPNHANRMGYLAYLAARGQRGDTAALFELQRLRPDEPAEDARRLTIRSARPVQPNAILYDGPVITHRVQRNGDVEYQRNGAALLVDQGKSVRLWQNDRDAIEIALRLAQQKFGPVLQLSGPLEFQMEAARVAADARLNVEFADGAINRMFVERRDILQELASRRPQETSRSTPPSGKQPETPTFDPGTPSPGHRADISDRGAQPPDPELGGDIER